MNILYFCQRRRIRPTRKLFQSADNRLFPHIRVRMQNRASEIETFIIEAVANIFTNDRLSQVRDCDFKSYRIWAKRYANKRMGAYFITKRPTLLVGRFILNLFDLNREYFCRCPSRRSRLLLAWSE